MDKFMMNGVKSLGNINQKQNYTDESTPASVPNVDKQRVGDFFKGASSNIPIAADVGKKGIGGTCDFGKISKMADDHSEFYTSKK